MLIASFKRINSDHQILTFLSANCKNNQQLIQNRVGIKGLMKFMVTNVATILIAMHCVESVDGVAVVVIDLHVNGPLGREIFRPSFV